MTKRAHIAVLMAALAFTGAAEAQGLWPQQRERQRQQRSAPTPPPETAPPPAAPAPARPAAPRAQQQAAPAEATAPPRPSGPAPYEKDMQRLGEILGALHYLRPLCGADDGPVWRDKMSELMEAEGGPEDRKERLAGAFNAGYDGFHLTYRSCTPSADLVVRRYLAEGARLSRDITTRHGNK